MYVAQLIQYCCLSAFRTSSNTKCKKSDLWGFGQGRGSLQFYYRFDTWRAKHCTWPPGNWHCTTPQAGITNRGQFYSPARDFTC